MAKDKMNIPQIRFKGFEGEWEIKGLNSIGNRYSGLTYSPENVQKKGVFVLRSSNIQNDFLIDADNVYVDPNVVNCTYVQQGDVIIVVRNGSRSLIGKHAIVRTMMPKTVIGAFMSAYRPKAGSGFFLNALLSTDAFHSEVYRSLGATINQITGKDFDLMRFQLPSFKEQIQIGDFFQKIDQVIELQQKALDTARAYKQSMLQKMFPQKGEKVPRVRFAGFNGDWEQRRLSDIVKINPSAQLPMTFKYVDLESVKGHILMNVRKEFRETAPSRAQRVAIKNDIFYQTVRPYQRNNYLFDLEDDDYVFSTGYAQLRPKKIIISLFLFSVIQTVEFLRKVLIRCTGTSYPAINSTDLGEINISFPSLKEQTAIGNFFQKLDQQIEQQAQKLATYQQLKKAMLQRMFV